MSYNFRRKKASIKGNKISMPKALEHYVAVTEYKKQEKGEITLKVGMLVEVVEKTETGKICQGSELLKRELRTSVVQTGFGP